MARKYIEKERWPQVLERTRDSIRIYDDEDKERGLLIFRHEGEFKTKTGKKTFGGYIGIIRFKIDSNDKEIYWQRRPVKVKGGRTLFMYDLIKIPDESVSKVGQALLRLAGERTAQTPEEVDIKRAIQKKADEEKTDKEMEEALKKYGI